ncbi:MAG: Cof-type HAD-IIB family hydrolase [Spirochaetaceae bacterium]|jgi:Cof subfamily protein (haloacid dehalogenase superfamily)|nr:Cof-type HAD-IIB family hydrolase [Spirochaetaceae bacterium]
MTPVRLLALDLDDTLLRSDLSISFRTRNAIRKAEGRGVTVVLASSRAPAAMEHFAALLGLNKKNGFLIANNGTMIQESQSGNMVFDIKIPSAAALLIFDMADAEGFAVQIYDDDIMYISRTNEFAEYDQKITGLRQVVVENFRSMVASGCHKMLIPGDPMILEPLARLLSNYTDGAAIYTSKPYLLEILPPGVDKGSALALVAEKLSIPREAVLAVGDSMNDEAMLRWAGYPVAMVNADDRIKEIAALVTEKSNDEDGVAEVIERYILGSEDLTIKGRVNGG